MTTEASTEGTTLATRLKRLRLQAGLSQRALADLIGHECTYAYLGRIERNERRRPSAEVALKLAGVLGARVEWLVHGHGRPPSAAAVRAAVERARARDSVDAGPPQPAV